MTGTFGQTSPWTVQGGTLLVSGDLSRATLLTVNSGGALSGTGTVGYTQINSSGTLAPGTTGVPGTSITVAGNLSFQPGAIYLVQINPMTASRANISGDASLAGTVQVSLAPGTYNGKTTYDILDPTSISGRFTDFTSNVSGIDGTLTYTPTNVLLNLKANLGAGGGLNANQHGVAGAINYYFNNGGTLPADFFTLFGLTGSNLTNTLSQLDGEAATGDQQAASQLMTEFLALMLDPSAPGRTDSDSASGFAAEQDASLPPDIALAYASVLKAPPKPATLDQRWSAWGSAFGSSNQTNGDPAAGTNDVTARTYGFASGMDCHFTRDTVLGFALAGGGTNWGLAQGLGGGRSDAFQTGVYGTTRSGPAYLAAALAFTNNWMRTSRIAIGDQLSAKFNAQSYGARLEAGYRYGMPIGVAMIGVTPYAALQVQDFHTPSYSETDLTGGGFALSYNAMNATDTRSELGVRFDDLTVLGTMPVTLRARAAWAHDWISNPALGAVFQALPGASFTINGAAPPKNSALASAGAELHLLNNWSLAGKFDGEFGSGSQTYAGTGTLRYTW